MDPRPRQVGPLAQKFQETFIQQKLPLNIHLDNYKYFH